MELESNSWQSVAAFIVFLSGAILLQPISRQVQLNYERCIGLYFWHTLLCIVYYWYALNNGADAVDYFLQSKRPDLEFSVGTQGVTYVTSLLSNTLGLSFIGCFLVFNIFGTIGLLLFDATLRAGLGERCQHDRILIAAVILLPSVSFWSSAIGKDSLAFLAICLTTWSAIDWRRRLGPLFVAIVILLFVRPHIAAIMVVALAASLLINIRIKAGSNTILAVVALASAAIVLPFALDKIGLDELASSVEFNEYIEERQGHNMIGGGSVDISDMNLIGQMLTYLFRPSFLEVTSGFTLAAAFDNLVLLYLFSSALVRRGQMLTIGSADGRLFLLLYSIGTWIILAQTTANLGIALRQKWMFLPPLIFLVLTRRDRRLSE